MSVEEVRGKVYRQEKVRLDGKLFMDCSFEDYLLGYVASVTSGEHSILESPSGA